MAESGASSAAQITAGNLRVDSATAEVLGAFEVAGIQSLLLKGASVTRWLSTPDDPRPYLDCDLLVGPADLTAAGQVLTNLGFGQLYEESEMPDWWREHGSTWTRSRDGTKVDLHRTLEGARVEPQLVWETLAGHTERLIVGGYPARALTIPGRAFHLALHAAQHGSEWERPLTDLERAISAADEAEWREAADLAVRLEATSSFAAGLRLIPQGRELADRLGLSHQVSVGVALRAETPPPVALGLDQLAQAKGARTRLAILWRKLVPPPSFMRHWSPTAREGRLGLLRAYLYRPFWLLARLPDGIRAWRRARRRAQHSGSPRN